MLAHGPAVGTHVVITYSIHTEGRNSRDRSIRSSRYSSRIVVLPVLTDVLDDLGTYSLIGEFSNIGIDFVPEFVHGVRHVRGCFALGEKFSMNEI